MCAACASRRAFGSSPSAWPETPSARRRLPRSVRRPIRAVCAGKERGDALDALEDIAAPAPIPAPDRPDRALDLPSRRRSPSSRPRQQAHGPLRTALADDGRSVSHRPAVLSSRFHQHGERLLRELGGNLSLPPRAKSRRAHRSPAPAPRPAASSARRLEPTTVTAA